MLGPPRRWPTAVLVFVVLSLAACSESAQPGSTSEGHRVQGTELTTSRGLAAGVIAHLPPGSVTRASGSLEGDPKLNVSVESSHDAATSVFVEVQAPSQAFRDTLSRCGVDSGYERVFCETDPSLLEVVRRGAGRPRFPDLIGRSYDERGALLVELWGSDGPESQELVKALLTDPLIGLKTSAGRNRDGEALPDFEVLELEVRAK